MLIISFACIAFYRKIGALMLVVPIVAFLISGLVIVTGYDLAFHGNETIHQVNTTQTIAGVPSCTSTVCSTVTETVTTSQTIFPANSTNYLIGNGQFQITGTGQLYCGYSLILLSLILGVIFVDQTVKGRLVLGD